jgi:hypothetical protein
LKLGAAAAAAGAIATAVVASAATPAPATMKPMLGGLLDRQFTATKYPFLGGVVVTEKWASLEPSAGTFNFSDIDSKLASAAKNGYGVKLRVYAGSWAPNWAKSIDGAPFPFYDHTAKTTTTLGRFWDPNYQKAWQGLMGALAARYDNNPTLREVNISGTGVESAEVMLVMASDSIRGVGHTNGQEYVAHGYTEAARQAALAGDVAFMARVWAHTRLDLFCSPLAVVSSTGAQSASLSATETLISRFAAAYPAQMVFGNTGLGVPVLTGGSGVVAMYNYIESHGYRFDLQTMAISNGLGNPSTVLGYASSHHITSVELPSGWQAWPTSLLTSVNNSLQSVARATK